MRRFQRSIFSVCWLSLSILFWMPSIFLFCCHKCGSYRHLLCFLCFLFLEWDTSTDLLFLFFFFFGTRRYGCLRIVDAGMAGWPPFTAHNAIGIPLLSTLPLSRITFCNADLTDLVALNCSASLASRQVTTRYALIRRTSRWSILLSVQYRHLTRLRSDLVPNWYSCALPLTVIAQQLPALRQLLYIGHHPRSYPKSTFCAGNA